MNLTAASRPPRVGRKFRTLSPASVIFFALAIGLAGGVLATVYYCLLEGLLHAVWLGAARTNPLSMTLRAHFAPKILVVTTLGGLTVGLITRWLGSAGEIAAVVDNIHMEDGRIDIRQTPAMTATSLASIAVGGSAGPEAPLVQIIGSFGSWLGERLNVPGATVRTFTFCGMGAALGAFFGAPLGGALFALEIPHRRGIEYYEALLPTVIASLAAFLLFRGLVGYDAVIFHLPSAGPLSVSEVFWSIGFGAVGVCTAAIFAGVFAVVGRLSHHLHRYPVILGTLGGIILGLLAQISPLSLFWSELQTDAVIHSSSAMVCPHIWSGIAGLLLLLAGIKILSISVTLHSGFRGGFIFPLMFLGACVAKAVVLTFPSVPASVAIIAMMASVNVAITKTPISTTVLLVTLTGLSVTPVVIAACVTSLLLSSRLNLIRTQRSRVDSTLEEPGSTKTRAVPGPDCAPI
jgi:H+/Cl- antiporter ClcA